MAMSMMLNSTIPASSASYAGNPLRFPVAGARPPPRRISTSVKCSADGGGEGGRVDRRNLLLGLGGMYGATAVSGSARGNPIQPPDLAACHNANYPDGYNDNLPVQCCPPYDLSKPLDIKPYVVPSGAPLRTRKPAHKWSQFEIDRYKRAVKEVKALPRSHPWNFMQQAQIHCVYCNEGYTQKGYNNIPLQLHFSWLFLPWHRWYLYFFEKILGKVVGDDTFALPFWNYDVEEGMKIPEFFKDRTSSLYNPNRNNGHKDEIMFLNWTYDLEDTPVSPNVVNDNLNLLATLFDEDSLTYPKLFMGDSVSAGELVNGATSDLSSGRCENMHNFVHMWVGQVEPPNLDMGNFFSAARDTLFYAHHANVDRFWELYRAKRGFLNEFDDTDWLDSTFLFYDENQKIVSVTTRGALSSQSLGVAYENVPIKYMTLPKGNAKQAPVGNATEFGPSRRPLDKNIIATVRRPKASRTPVEKAKEAELLSIDGIQLTTPDAAAFDVYLSNASKQGNSELVGTFSRVRHNNTQGDGSLSRITFHTGITGAVERIGADADETVVVTLVPRTGNVTIGGLHIELVKKQFF